MMNDGKVPCEFHSTKTYSNENFMIFSDDEIFSPKKIWPGMGKTPRTKFKSFCNKRGKKVSIYFQQKKNYVYIYIFYGVVCNSDVSSRALCVPSIQNVVRSVFLQKYFNWITFVFV
jgi:hypothetical protein